MGNDGAGAKDKIFRIVDLLMSCPYHPPTLEEHAMFMAYAAATRSGDLSRQVGAVVTTLKGDIIASGANDAPAKGGSYWPEDPAFVEVPDPHAGPDYLRGYDSNERERNKILAAVIESLLPDEAIGRERSSEERSALVTKYKDRLRSSGILDLTEFGRAVHAEMAALMSCARSGASPVDGVLYCTTFPCHNCAKHIIAAGISKVVYIEPYPKSKAKQLYDEVIHLPDDADSCGAGHEAEKYVSFVPFEGVGPRRFIDLFSLSLGSGRTIFRKQRDADGARVEWRRERDSAPRLPLDPRSYLEREDAAAKVTRQRLQGYDMGYVEDEPG
jgi:cytidine deaminase